MLTEHTIERLSSMRLTGMAAFLETWLRQPPKDVSPTELVGLLADAEWVHRENQKQKTRLSRAQLRQEACLEDIDYGHHRGLVKSVVLELYSSRWMAERQNIILEGPTGIGKSYLACAFGHRACRDGYTVLYRRTRRLLEELAQARADGSYSSLMRKLAKAHVLILDDFAVEPLAARDRRELLEVIEDRYGTSSTIIASQMAPDDGHAQIGDQTVADAICDRLVHNAHRIKLAGESIRKAKALTATGSRGKAK